MLLVRFEKKEEAKLVKKILSLFMTAAVIFSLAACSAPENQEDDVSEGSENRSPAAASETGSVSSSEPAEKPESDVL